MRRAGSGRQSRRKAMRVACAAGGRARESGISRFDLYEACAQDPARDARLVASIHGGAPRILGEDFAGTGAISRAWVEQVRQGRAIAVDIDAEPLARLSGVRGVTARVADVMAVRARADVIAVMNFSICQWHERESLVRYLRHARSRLRPGGVFVASLFGGADTALAGRYRQSAQLPDGRRVTYEWEQRGLVPATGRIACAMHFRVGRSPWLRDAFVYDWRLWSIVEVRDAMRDAGFARTEVFDHGQHALDVEGGIHACPLDEDVDPASFQALVVGRDRP